MSVQTELPLFVQKINGSVDLHYVHHRTHQSIDDVMMQLRIIMSQL